VLYIYIFFFVVFHVSIVIFCLACLKLILAISVISFSCACVQIMTWLVALLFYIWEVPGCLKIFVVASSSSVQFKLSLI
jgi:hypothetical protein